MRSRFFGGVACGESRTRAPRGIFFCKPLSAHLCDDRPLSGGVTIGTVPYSGSGGEPRAAMSMARLWRDQGKRVEARDLLAPVYGWFTEGFDTLDLKEAKSLLDELAS